MSDDTTTEQRTMHRIRKPSDDEIREIVDKARSLSVGGDVVELYGFASDWGLSSMHLSSLLFTAEVFQSHQYPDDNVIVRLEEAPVTFQGHGEGYVHLEVEADPDTHETESLKVRAHL